MSSVPLVVQKLNANRLVTFGANEISSYHGKHQFLKGISFTATAGNCLGILGDNGSGKSSLMAILAGVVPAGSGEVLFNGHPITKEQRHYVGYVPQQPVLLDQLTVKDNLALWQSVYHRKGSLLEHIPDFLKIEEMLHKKAGLLSGGMRKKVSIAIALMNDPQVLILDEAFAALDAKCVASMEAYIKQAKDMVVIYSSHNILEIAHLCTNVFVLKEGCVSYDTQDSVAMTEESVRFLYSQF